MNLYGSRSVGEHPLVLHAFDRSPLARLGQAVRGDGGRRRQRLFEEGPAALVGDDGDTLGRERPQAAGVIEVMMTVDDVADGLGRHQVLDLTQDRHRALLVSGASTTIPLSFLSMATL